MNPRRALVALAILAGAMSLASPAHAGGAVWDVEPLVAAPGDEVEAWTGVSWAHDPDLGTPDDGPFLAWLVPAHVNEWGDLSMHYGPPVPADAVLLGEITVAEAPYRNQGPNSARFTFTVPDLAPGVYEIVHCNDPCTTSLGDVTFGYVSVSAPDGSVPVPPTTAPPTTTSPPAMTNTSAETTTTTTAAPAMDETDEEAAAALTASVGDDGPTGSGAAWIVTAALLIAVGAGVLATRSRPSTNARS